MLHNIIHIYAISNNYNRHNESHKHIFCIKQIEIFETQLNAQLAIKMQYVTVLLKIL